MKILDSSLSSRFTDAAILGLLLLLLITGAARLWILYFSIRNGVTSDIFLFPKNARMGFSLEMSIFHDFLLAFAQGV